MTSDIPKNKMLSRQQELMNAFDFTMRDLAANREGTITETHKRAVLRREQQRWMLYIYLLLGCIFLSLLFWGIAQNNPDGGFVMSYIYVGAVYVFPLIALALLPFFLWGFFVRHRIGNELKREQVAVLQGIAVVDTSYERRQYGDVTVNNTKLNAKRDAVLRIKHLEPHIIYYLPRTKVILSVEAIEQ
jgi:hypothetical protein